MTAYSRCVRIRAFSFGDHGRQGKAVFLKNFHEISAYCSYVRPDLEISYWKLSSGHEVDFVLDDLSCAIEAKSSVKVNDRHLKGLREIIKDQPGIKKRVLVCNESKSRKEPDGIEILSVDDFICELCNGELL